MLIGFRLRQLREERNLSQSDIELRTGLLRTYISRIENGHISPSLETLEKLSTALGLKLYQVLCEPDVPSGDLEQIVGSGGKWERSYLSKLRKLLWEMSDRDRQLFLYMASGLVQNRKRRI